MGFIIGLQVDLYKVGEERHSLYFSDVHQVIFAALAPLRSDLNGVFPHWAYNVVQQPFGHNTETDDEG
jgi:hypothetical protein